MHKYWCSHCVGDASPRGGARGARKGVSPMMATVAVVGVILISFIVGSLTSSVETEQALPHRF